MNMKKIALTIGLILLLTTGYLCFWPVPIQT